MTIKDKIRLVKQDKKYRFCELNFDIYETDYIRIYSKLGGTCIFSETFKDFKEREEIQELINLEPAKEELIKLERGVYALCFYLGTPKEIVEDPISAKIIYID